MEGLGLTWFDGAAIVILAFSGVMAFARGLIREVFSIVAFIGAAIAAIYLAEHVRPIVEQFTSLRGSLAALAAGLFIFLAVFVIVTVITSMVAKQAHDSADVVGGFDRLGGAIFGVVRGVLVVALFVLLMRQTTDDRGVVQHATIPSAITNARTYPMFEAVAIGLERLLPQAKERASDYIEKRRHRDSVQPAATDPAPAPLEGAPAPAAPPPGDAKGQTKGQ
ncbi:MAG: CvpA family protein [Hyphomonadaceae bacterium]|nr:CvpA family protein [Hyphomonadaceae bacterium]